MLMKRYLITKKYLVEANSVHDADMSYTVEDCIFHKCVEIEGDIDGDTA